MNNSIENWRSLTWHIRPALNMPDLDPDAVQFAVLDSDPIQSFRKSLVQNRETFRKTLEAEPDPNRRNLLKTSQVTTTWDQLFKATTGDQIYLLTPSQSKRNQSLARTLLISSNAPAGRKWVTTKVAYRDQQPICWCIEVDTAIGREIQVELRSENSVHLKQLYDQFMTAN